MSEKVFDDRKTVIVAAVMLVVGILAGVAGTAMYGDDAGIVGSESMEKDAMEGSPSTTSDSGDAMKDDSMEGDSMEGDSMDGDKMEK